MARKKAVPSMAEQEAQWKAEGDARTLQEAAAIQSDPKRMGPAKAHLNKQMQYIKKVCGKTK